MALTRDPQHSGGGNEGQQAVIAEFTTILTNAEQDIASLKPWLASMHKGVVETPLRADAEVAELKNLLTSDE